METTTTVRLEQITPYMKDGQRIEFVQVYEVKTVLPDTGVETVVDRLEPRPIMGGIDAHHDALVADRARLVALHAAQLAQADEQIADAAQYLGPR